MNLDELNLMINQKIMMSLADRKKAIRWLAYQNDLIIQDIFKLKKNHFHRLKSEGAIIDIILVDTLAFYLAIKEMIAKTKISNRKNRSGDFSFLKKIGETRARQLRKPRANLKREKLLNLHGVIRSLIEVENYSYRGVSDYLKTYHRFLVSHTAIRQFYLTIKIEQ